MGYESTYAKIIKEICKEEDPNHTEAHYCEDGSQGVLVWAGRKFDFTLPDNYFYQG